MRSTNHRKVVGGFQALVSILERVRGRAARKNQRFSVPKVCGGQRRNLRMRTLPAQGILSESQANFMQDFWRRIPTGRHSRQHIGLLQRSDEIGVRGPDEIGAIETIHDGLFRQAESRIMQVLIGPRVAVGAVQRIVRTQTHDRRRARRGRKRR